MTFSLRWYQEEAVNALFRYFIEGGTGNPLVVCPTGGGKALLIAEFIRRAMLHYPQTRVLNVIHTRELVKQNEIELRTHWPEAITGVYSAGLGRRNLGRPITFCSIQSVYKKASAFGHIDLLIIDEAHMVPQRSEAMYGRLINGLRQKNPHMRVIGFTATPYRLDSGGLVGNDRLFTDIVYNVDLGRLVEEGFLSRLVSKQPKTHLDTTGLHTRQGEFIASEMEERWNIDAVNIPAVEEMVDYGRDRKAWLVFCVTVQHAKDVCELIRSHGIIAEVVEGSMSKDKRTRAIEAFKRGKIRCLVSVNVLLIGFNAPRVDMIALLRATQSTGLYVQILGRGMRTAPGKNDCLVLDYGLNIYRHGPVDMIPAIPPTKMKGQNKEAVIPCKTCPECSSIVPIALRQCPDCGHEWPAPEPQIQDEAETEEVMIAGSSRKSPRSEDTPWRKIVGYGYFKHTPRDDRPPSMRCEYVFRDGKKHVEAREWVCFEHTGFPRQKAAVWWQAAGGTFPIPVTVDEALLRQNELAPATHIIPEKNGRYWNVRQIGRFGSADDDGYEDPLLDEDAA